MANSELRDPRKTLHFLMAFRRRKDNADGQARCIRQIVKNYDEDLEVLKVKLKRTPGVWRIHRTVNARSVEKATKLLMHRLIENPADAEGLESVWRTCLLQKECRAERMVMLDIDDPAAEGAVMAAVGDAFISRHETPSGGLHIVANSFDTRPFEGIENVSVLRDGYVFVEICEV